MTITEFLTARLDEDEAVARAAIDPDRPGTHWAWRRTVDDATVAAPTQEDGQVSLRTVEMFPISVGFPTSVTELPAFALDYVEADEVRAMPHIARHDPARVLAEVEAKRRIVALHGPGEHLLSPAVYPYTRCVTCQPRNVMEVGDTWPCDTLRLLALPYADHRDYDEAWRP